MSCGSLYTVYLKYLIQLLEQFLCLLGGNEFLGLFRHLGGQLDTGLVTLNIAHILSQYCEYGIRYKKWQKCIAGIKESEAAVKSSPGRTTGSRTPSCGYPRGSSQPGHQPLYLEGLVFSENMGPGLSNNADRINKEISQCKELRCFSIRI